MSSAVSRNIDMLLCLLRFKSFSMPRRPNIRTGGHPLVSLIFPCKIMDRQSFGGASLHVVEDQHYREQTTGQGEP